MRHMTLAEWDTSVAPILGVIEIRCRSIHSDLTQVREWIERMPAIPMFETNALAALERINAELKETNEILEQALITYNSKEKVS